MDTTNKKRSNSLINIFFIFIKTSRRRVLLTLVCGVVIFILITSFSLLAYNYRYNFYLNYLEENENYLNDGFVSVSSSRFTSGDLNFTPSFLEEIAADFSTFPDDYFPNVEVINTTTYLSAQLFTRIWDPLVGNWEAESNKVFTVDDESFSLFNASLIYGRLPQNASELAIIENQNNIHNTSDYIDLYQSEYLDYSQNFSIVGIIKINEEAFIDAGISVDIFDYTFNLETNFFNYEPRETFVTNYSLFRDLTDPYTLYRGQIQYLVDMEYDCSEIRISKLNEYILNLPRPTGLPTSLFIQSYVLPCEDLEVVFLGFIDGWIAKTIRLMTINMPILLIIGLVTAVVLNIGAKDLDSAYRRMKMHGLSYNKIRAMVFLENSSFSIISLLTGVGIGLGINFLIIYNQPNRPLNYYVDFLREPLLFLLIGTFFLGFLVISYIIQNTIAKKASKTISEGYKTKRVKFKNMFSTNEFRLFTFTLLLTLISVALYFLFGREDSTAISTNISYVTIFWFLVSCSVAMLLVFVLLIMARIINLFWTLVNKLSWKKNFNIGSLAIKHLTVSKKTYQFAIFTALIFGVLILPSLGIESSLKENLKYEANLNIGSSDLAIVDWVDPEDERDYIFDDIDGIVNFTEVIFYRVINYEATALSPAITLNLVALEDIEMFLDVVNFDLLNDPSWNQEDILSLNKMDENGIMLDKKSARKLDFEPGNSYISSEFTRNYHNFSVKQTYNYFPCNPIPKKSIFDTARKVYSFVGNYFTIKRITNDISFSAGVQTIRYKLIKVENETVIPSIKSQLASYEFVKEENIYNLDDMRTELYLEIDNFSKYNIYFYAFLISILIIFVGYFTGLKAFDERIKVVEILYRVGSERRKMLGIFMIENSLINALPLIFAMFVSLPLIRIVEIYAFGVKEIFYKFKPGIPVWLFILMILLGLLGSALGWIIGMLPQLLRYKPVKQE